MRMPKIDKHIDVQKSSSSLVAVVAIATIIVVFCLVSARALLNQGAYQRRVVNEKHETVKTLEDNVKHAETLMKQYEVFEATNPNALGGPSNVDDSAMPPAGKNSRIVLDALPSSYDFPALISSLAKVTGVNGIAETNIGGTDQSAEFSNAPAANPQPVTIADIPISGAASYGQIQNLVKDLERSIRPFDITSLQLSVTSNNVQVTLNVSTYYQPAKGVILENKVVK